jgi:hypothetical protein
MTTKELKTEDQLVESYSNMFGSFTGAVFNGHINDADVRARTFMRVVCPAFLKEVEKIEKEENGIMGLFKNKPTVATATYIMLVNAFVLEA